MKNSWKQLFRRLAVGCAATSATAWSSAMCYAVQVLYSDHAGADAYSDGWQEGDDGDGPGGFGPWNFDGVAENAATAYGQTTVLMMDDGLKSGTQTSSPWNDIGRSWVLHNPAGRNVGDANGAAGTDIAQPGRTFPALQVGQTLSVLVDNPTERHFFRGYAVKLNSGPDASGCYAGDNCSTPAYDPGSVKVAWGVGTFEYFDDGPWDGTPLFDTDTDLGVQIDFTLTSATEYEFKMTPLDTMFAPYTGTGTLGAAVTEIDWIELEFYNTDSDFYPVMITDPQPTDFFVREMKITIPDAPGVPGDYNNNGTVDAADYVLWRNGGPLANEVNEPGEVNSTDYFEWRARFGNTSGGGASSGVPAAAVPEPSAIGILIVGIGGLLMIGRRGKGCDDESSTNER